MELTVDQMLQQGVAAHNANNLQEAERLYKAILQSQPMHAQASHNLGLVAVSMNQSGVALPLFKNAIDANPNIEQFWLSYIEALIVEGYFEDAKRALKKGKKKGVDKAKLKILTQKLVSFKAGNIPAAAPPETEIQKLTNCYNNGEYGEAEKLAISISIEFPRNQYAWKMLGVLLGRKGMKAEALNANQKSLELAPQDAEAHYNMGVTLKEMFRLDEAEAVYRNAIELKPDYAEAHNNLGNIHKDLSRLDAAEASYKRATALKSGFFEAHSNLGNTLQELGRLQEAEESYRQAIALKSDSAEAHYNMGVTLKELGRLNEAEASYRQAISLRPDYVEAHINLGIALQELGKLKEAEVSHRQAIELKFGYAEAHNNLSITLQDLGNLEGAEASCRQAINLKPGFAEAHYSMCLILKELGRSEEAEASCRQALLLKPDFEEAKFQKSLLLLNRQDFQLGWSLYYPRRVSTFDHNIKRATRWKGTSLRGKNIQVYAAHGVGDEIMFSSCIPDLMQESPNAIYLESDPRLQPLFARSFPGVIAYGRERRHGFTQIDNGSSTSIEDVRFDYSLPIDGLPKFFRNKIEDFSNRDAFLVPDPASVDKWGQRLADLGEGLKIGISWLGGASKIHKKHSIPLSHWKNLLSVDAFFVNLQYGDTTAEVAQFSAENNIEIYDWEDNDALLDLDNQAALISNLDLVISVDNATVHSCVALGKDVWNLIDPSLNLMWMENGTNTSPLSPHLRLFKKRRQDSWSDILSYAEEKLREKIDA
ncbi:tetratricopeptide repeat protein [Gammaproteobacteria bacterium]|nr:tetratricopeptide repeat protein [Gammaproteobacteria bacterium]